MDITAMPLALRCEALSSQIMRQWFKVICIFLLSCEARVDQSEELSTHEYSFLEIQNELRKWKQDSLGCLGLRNPTILFDIIDQQQWEKQDSTTIFQLLGQPNGQYGSINDRHFIYYIQCGKKGETSWSNFYLHISTDRTYFSAAIH